jgi:hypothetical protein
MIPKHRKTSLQRLASSFHSDANNYWKLQIFVSDSQYLFCVGQGLPHVIRGEKIREVILIYGLPSSIQNDSGHSFVEEVTEPISKTLTNDGSYTFMQTSIY